MINLYREIDASKNFWGDPSTPRLNQSLLQAIKSGPLTQNTDIEVAQELISVVHQEYEKYGTEGTSLPESDIELAQKTLQVLLGRLSINFQLPWRNFSAFRSYWNSNNAYGSWQARRDILNRFFTPVEDELDRRELLSYKASLVDPISPREFLGWEAVDQRIHAMRRRFSSAQTSEDYSDVGNRAIAVLEALGDVIYNPEKHLMPGEPPIPKDKTKNRFDRYIDEMCKGKKNEGLRKIVKGSVEMAHQVKHSSTSSRRDAGLIADSVLLLSNIIRRLEEPETTADQPKIPLH